jgi:hypothetical protein
MAELTAVATNNNPPKRKILVPPDLDRPEVMRKFLADIDLELPMQVTFGGLQPTLRAAGRTFTVPAIDVALAVAEIPVAERLYVKRALINHRLVVG